VRDRASAAELSAEYLRVGSSSFNDFVRRVAPDVLPSPETTAAAVGGLTAHATTIVAATFPGGVVMAGDRRATMGNVIAQRDIEKVFPADEFSVIGMAGAAGIGIELIGLFQVELEHYEKLEGAPLSLVGKANRLATLVRANLGMAMQGLVVVPLFAGWDLAAERGRIFSYDATGGKYEEHAFFSVGSGSVFARGSLKKLYREDFGADEATMAVIQALYDAADDDSATGGPDLTRRIFPVVLVATAEGVQRVSESQVAGMVGDMMQGRTERPDGPGAPLA
jgi:proteasome beta subunit